MYGVGAAKLNRYADEFLPIIEAYCQENNLEEKPKPGAVLQTMTAGSSRTDEVLALYNSGQSIPQICEIYGNKQKTVLGHLWKAFLSGNKLRSSDLLTYSSIAPQEQERVLEAFAELGPDYLRPIYDAMNGTVEYDELALLRLHFVSQKQTE
jgi:ATP-dependent DNA helicase RecQ